MSLMWFGIDSNIFLNVPAGSQSGEKLRIASGGYIDKDGNRGDLLLNIKIMIPKRMSEEEKELFLKLKDISRYNPRNV